MLNIDEINIYFSTIPTNEIGKILFELQMENNALIHKILNDLNKLDKIEALFKEGEKELNKRNVKSINLTNE